MKKYKYSVYYNKFADQICIGCEDIKNSMNIDEIYKFRDDHPGSMKELYEHNIIIHDGIGGTIISKNTYLGEL